MFAGYSQIPELDINGSIAAAEAKRCVLNAFEEHLAARGWAYRKTEEDGLVTYRLEACRPAEIVELWGTVEKAMNKAEGGPGIDVCRPSIEGTSSFQNGSVVTATRVVFWSDTASSRSTPPARFRGQ
jgi:hypothetical protein